MDEPARKLKATITQSLIALLTVLAIVGTLFCSNALAAEATQDGATVQPPTTPESAGVMKFGLLAAAVAFGLGALGAGFAISHVGAAAMGAVAEKPQIAGQALIFVALAEGIVVFGFITALMILGKL
ncbi:MAG TPA: ATP synthase subunit C [Sedimentisphaerales bacterium]|nr:ATP synthase subunit C [Sedimentisphaerales bacterium]HRS10737.1 ATP synthase subunit C [Sedimentisphaerales bacterium]HRV47442.1 ATP synthase subunit C [Sedimentisphaerales bacterium]